MMLSNFTTTTHGKWILAGEHAVLRSFSALVFPVINKKMTLTYLSTEGSLGADFFGESGEGLHLLFWSVLEEGMKQLGKSLNSLNGHFSLHSNIPIGVGMGASAALCVATARWFEAQHFISHDELNSFSTQLENLFHGKSSGLDIAGVATTHGIRFNQGKCYPLNQTWAPHWYLSSCGQIGITSRCINQVQSIWDADPKLGQQIDEQMERSVQEAQEALESNTPVARKKLENAINNAGDCFHKWGLISESLQNHILKLKNAGAIAVKPTGSGGGGFVLSLWEKAVSEEELGFIAI